MKTPKSPISHRIATLNLAQRRPERSVDTHGRVFLQVRDGVAVCVHRDSDRGMAETFAGDLRVNASP